MVKKHLLVTFNVVILHENKYYILWQVLQKKMH